MKRTKNNRLEILEQRTRNAIYLNTAANLQRLTQTITLRGADLPPQDRAVFRQLQTALIQLTKRLHNARRLTKEKKC